MLRECEDSPICEDVPTVESVNEASSSSNVSNIRKGRRKRIDEKKLLELLNL